MVVRGNNVGFFGLNTTSCVKTYRDACVTGLKSINYVPPGAVPAGLRSECVASTIYSYRKVVHTTRAGQPSTRELHPPITSRQPPERPTQHSRAAALTSLLILCSQNEIRRIKTFCHFQTSVSWLNRPKSQARKAS